MDLSFLRSLTLIIIIIYYSTPKNLLFVVHIEIAINWARFEKRPTYEKVSQLIGRRVFKFEAQANIYINSLAGNGNSRNPIYIRPLSDSPRRAQFSNFPLRRGCIRFLILI